MIISFRGAYRFLSNFYPALVLYDGVIYPSVEHAYQAAKSPNRHYREEILQMTAGQAKRHGQTITLPIWWPDYKEVFMAQFVADKFTRTASLGHDLLNTGDAYLREGNTWGDTFWGVDVKTGQGDNRLGHILMAVRTSLRKAPIVKIPQTMNLCCALKGRGYSRLVPRPDQM